MATRSSGRACGKRKARSGRTYIDVRSLVNQLVEKVETTTAHRRAGSQRRTRSARSRVMMRVPVLLLDDEGIVVVRPVEGPLDRATIDEEGGGGGDAHARPRLHVHPDARLRGGGVEAGPERPAVRR